MLRTPDASFDRLREMIASTKIGTQEYVVEPSEIMAIRALARISSFVREQIGEAKIAAVLPLVGDQAAVVNEQMRLLRRQGALPGSRPANDVLRRYDWLSSRDRWIKEALSPEQWLVFERYKLDFARRRAKDLPGVPRF